MSTFNRQVFLSKDLEYIRDTTGHYLWWHRREKTGKTVNLDPRVHPFTRTFKHVDPWIEVSERLGKWKTK